MRGGKGEGVGEFGFRRVQPQKHDAAAEGVAFGDAGCDVGIGRGRRLAFQFPPIWFEAQIIEMVEGRGDGVILQRAVLAGDDFQQPFAAQAAGGVLQLEHAIFLLGLHLRAIIHAIKAQAFDDMIDGPFDELGANVATAFELKRAGTGKLHRAADP